MSPRIRSVVTTAILDADIGEATYPRSELQRHQVSLPGLPVAGDLVSKETETPLALPKADPGNPAQIGNLPFDTVLKQVLATQGDAKRGNENSLTFPYNLRPCLDRVP
jgi:hypothetical protein